MSKRRRENRGKKRPTGSELREKAGLPPLSVMGKPLSGPGSTVTAVIDGVEHMFEPLAASWAVGSGSLRHNPEAERMMAALSLRAMVETDSSLVGLSLDEYIETLRALVAAGYITNAGLDLPKT